MEQYFALAARADEEAYLAQFTPDAVVEDEGRLHRGLDAVRAWRAGVPLVRYRVVTGDRDGEAERALVEVAGDFPGSPVELVFRFERAADGRIRDLRIRS